MEKISLVLNRISVDSAQVGQICSLIVYLYNEKHEDDSYVNELQNLTSTLVSRSFDKLIVVKRWAKRCICDDKFPVGKLLKYINSDDELAALATRVQDIVDKKDILAVNSLEM